MNTEVEGLPPPGTEFVSVASDSGTGSLGMTDLLRQIVEEIRPRAVLEFGTGESSDILAEALAAIGGGALTCVDHQAPLAAPWLDRAGSAGNVDLHVLHSPLNLRATRDGVIFTYIAAREAIASRGPYDLVFIGAPPEAWGRHCTLPLVYGSLNDRALVVVAGGGGRRMRACVRRWLMTHGSLQVMKSDRDLDGRGVMVLVRSGRGHRRTSIACAIGNTWDVLRAWPERWVARRRSGAA